MLIFVILPKILKIKGYLFKYDIENINNLRYEIHILIFNCYLKNIIQIRNFKEVYNLFMLKELAANIHNIKFRIIQ